MHEDNVTVLAVDLASGGVSASLLRSDLTAIRTTRTGWWFVPDSTGRKTLSASFVWDQTRHVIGTCVSGLDPPKAIALSAMMHTLVLTNEEDVPLSPIYTWMDTIRLDDAQGVRERLGEDYSRRTGTYFHPSFPAFKLARLGRETPVIMSHTHHILSVKAYVGARLTGNWAEDVATASASGLLNLHTGEWDETTLDALQIDRTVLPPVISPEDPLGPLSDAVARQLHLPSGTPVIAGGGDGFLATLGSGCETPASTSITVGTTSSVRRFNRRPSISPRTGTFCYRYGPDAFLVGAASNNGGNTLDWARQELGLTAFPVCTTADEPPLFFPHFHGERSPFWDPHKQARWILPPNGTTLHTLGWSVVEGVAFQLGIYFELVGEVLGRTSQMSVLSGNGFQTPGLAATLAAVIPGPVIEPRTPGLATLRGAARCAFQALGIETEQASQSLVAEARTVEPDPAHGLAERYKRFRAGYFTG